jgi:hypothetical protein
VRCVWGLGHGREWYEMGNDRGESGVLESVDDV